MNKHKNVTSVFCLLLLMHACSTAKKLATGETLNVLSSQEKKDGWQ